VRGVSFALLLAFATSATPVWAAAKAKPAGDIFTRAVGRYAAAHAARAQFKQLIKREEQLNRQYAGYKSAQVGEGTGVSTAVGLGMAGAGVWLTKLVADTAVRGVGVVETVTAALGVTGLILVRDANARRDIARGNTVRFALANGFKVDRKLITEMNRSGGFGKFDAAAIAPFRLHPKQGKKG
jgi:hypothetical protein